MYKEEIILKKKILLASGNKRFDDFIRDEIKDLYDFYDISQYSAEVLVNRLKEDDIQILLIGERLSTARPLIEEIRDIITEMPSLTIVIYSKGQKQKGDEFFNELLNIGINRFIHGNLIDRRVIISALEDEVTPETYLKWRPEKYKVTSEDGEKVYDFSKLPASPEEIIDLVIQSNNEQEILALLEKLAQGIKLEKIQKL